MSGYDNKEEVLPKTISLQQYYSPIHDNYDYIDDNDVTLQDVGVTVFPITMLLEQRYSPYHNNYFRDNDDFHDETEGDNVCAEPSNNMKDTHFNNDGDDGGAVRSRRRIDPLTSLAPTLPLNMVAPRFVSSCDSEDISVGKLFAEKNKFILQLRKVAFRNKFDFKIARSTMTRFEGHCCSESYMQQEYGVQLTYQHAYRAREVSLEIVRGNPAESYNLLPKYSHVLTTTNEGTVTHLEQDGDDNFLYYFVALGSSIKGFMQYIRPVIAVDSTHLKGLYRRNMFVTTCLNGNINCNIKSQFRMSKALWDQFEPAFINAAKAYGHEKFKRQLEGLWMIHSGAADYLENNVGTCNCARSQFEGRRYNILTTNIAESVNSFMREPRKFLVTHLVDHFRKTLQQWFFYRKIMAESMSTRLTTWTDEIVTERRTIAERMIVRPVSPDRFQVICGGLKEGLVDLQKKTCSCRVFQLDQLVCAHAIAACLTHRVDFINLCSDFYTTKWLVIAYAQPVEPVGDVADWKVSDEIQEMQVYPPVEAPLPGRRKELRIPSAGEDVNRRTVRCGRCHELGYNRKRCKNLIASTRS
ncbi:SWIM-type domain-containing protein [Citrus sinensis]|uniref:SWIM-type domain-containing protein n=1 Tax=Citrus sinensis TaxID=2711 RepID=A0ACB8MLR5_CITSI|nr:SWIM-type domain-containing protein [Citrus sinensis]